jgi:hypothetical protein
MYFILNVCAQKRDNFERDRLCAVMLIENNYCRERLLFSLNDLFINLVHVFHLTSCRN